MRIPKEIMQQRFFEILIGEGFENDVAQQCAAIFTANSVDGVYTHGLNRFPTFVNMIREGLVAGSAKPVLESRIGQIEQWNGHLAPGMLNASFCMNQAINLASENGIGCVAIRNTNHWMRGGTYGWQAAESGFIGICFTNTIANIPPWGGLDPRLGNNPLIIAVPAENGHVVLDMAVSQYSVGKLMQYKASGHDLPVVGGYDSEGQLSYNATDILESKRLLPVGFWKGSGLSLMLDLLAAILSNGQATREVTESGKESGLSQVFIAIKPNEAVACNVTQRVLEFFKSSRPELDGEAVRYPGERTLHTRNRNLKEGIPVDENIWKQVLGM